MDFIAPYNIPLSDYMEGPLVQVEKLGVISMVSFFSITVTIKALSYQLEALTNQGCWN